LTEPIQEVGEMGYGSLVPSINIPDVRSYGITKDCQEGLKPGPPDTEEPLGIPLPL